MKRSLRAQHFNPAYSLDRAAAAHPSRTSLWYGERMWTVSEAASETCQLARLLISRGVREGDRVVIIARNSPYHLLLHVACARIGAIFVPVSYRFSYEELSRILAKLEPRLIVADPETASVLAGAPTQYVDFDGSASFAASLGFSTSATSAGSAGSASSGGSVASVESANSLGFFSSVDSDVSAGSTTPTDPAVFTDSSRQVLRPSSSHVPSWCPTSDRFAPSLFVIDDDVQAHLPEGLDPNRDCLTKAFEHAWEPLSVSAANAGSSHVGSHYEANWIIAKGSCDVSSRVEGLHPIPDPLVLYLSGSDTGIQCSQAPEYPEGIGAIILTSGSTGEPKFVPLTHEQLWWGSQNFREGFEYSTIDVELVVAPLTHIGGFNGTTLDLFAHGGTVVVVREFRPAVVLAELERRSVAMMFAVPTMYAALMRDPAFASTNLSAFRLPLTGGGPASAELLRALDSAGLHVLNVWGMTETAAAGSYLPAEHLSQRPGSIGRPFAHVEARIVPLEDRSVMRKISVVASEVYDTPEVSVLSASSALSEVFVASEVPAVTSEQSSNSVNDTCCSSIQVIQHVDPSKYTVDGAVVTSCQVKDRSTENVGELWLRGPNVVTEYWRDADATAVGFATADDGDAPWLCTGDVVRADADGYLWSIGRVDDIINTGGEKVAPTEVMRVLAAYPGVSDVEVVGIPDETWGQAVAAAVIMQPGEPEPGLRSLRDFAAPHLADYKLPRAVRILDSFPVNSNGKLDRAALAALF